MRSVTTGPTGGDLISITKGLAAGETVVVDGADQLRDGASIIAARRIATARGGGAGGDTGRSGQGQQRHRPGG